jgi:hypothetical protein
VTNEAIAVPRKHPIALNAASVSTNLFAHLILHIKPCVKMVKLVNSIFDKRVYSENAKVSPLDDYKILPHDINCGPHFLDLNKFISQYI